MSTHPAPRSGRSGLALLVIAAAQLLMVMDGTIVTVGLPVIATGLRIPEADLDWVLTSYALAFGGLLLAGGRAGDLLGRRRLFRAGLVVFLAASLLGGLAGNGTVLIAARVLQGLGAAIVAPAALSLLTDTFPAGPRRNKALGVYGAMGGLGSVAGLLLGGALTEYLGWRWIMFVNIPIALLVLAGTVALAPGSRRPGHLDVPGAATVTLALGSLVYAINRAGTHGVTDGLTLTFGAATVVLLLAFLRIQRTARDPMLPPGVLADRGRLGANLVMLLMGAGQLATFYFLTLYMQTIKQYSPMITGLAYLPFAIGIGLGSGLIGPRLQARTTTRTVLAIGMSVAAVAMAWFSLLTPGQNPLLVLLPAQLAGGIGLGIGFVAATIGGVQGVTSRDSGIASGLVNTSQQIGGALGLAVLAGIAVTATSGRPPGTSPHDALTAGYTTGMLGAGAFYLAAILTAVVLMRPRRGPEPAPAGALDEPSGTHL
ncbi:MFS transporter [Nonomuraea sp. SBT364]|uniref:MFS transporter n=1 Tax=Nonomuraea sp. SBT364 TaxID=1580530 RepID=UPI00066B83C6|nr:MFS transporter [Nonomuraea sp. SBT364]